MSFSGSRSSFRNTSVRSFIEDNEKILSALDLGSVANSERDNYSDLGDDSSECFPSLQQSILDFAQRHGMSEVHKSLMSPGKKGKSTGRRSQASSVATDRRSQSEVAKDKMSQSGRNSISSRKTGPADSFSVSSRKSQKSSHTTTTKTTQQSASKRDTASVASRQSRTENIEAMSNCSRLSKRSQKSARDDRSFKTNDLETGSVVSNRSRRSQSLSTRRMTDKESSASKKQTAADRESVENIQLNAMLPYGSPRSKAPSIVSRASRAKSVRSTTSTAKMSFSKPTPREEDALVKSSAPSRACSKTPQQLKFDRHSSLEDSYQVFLENKKKLIIEKWAREDSARNGEEDLIDDYEIFMRYVRKPYKFTGIKRQIVDVYPGYQEEPYEYRPVKPNIPDNPSERMLERMSIPVMERLFSPKPVKKEKPPKVIHTQVQNEFVMRQMAHDAEKRRKETRREQRRTRTPNPKKPEIFEKLYRSSITNQMSSSDEAETPKKSGAKWTNDPRWWRPKEVPPPAEPVDLSEFRSERFGQHSQDLTADKPSLYCRASRDFIDVIEEYRESQMEKRKIAEYYSHMEQ